MRGYRNKYKENQNFKDLYSAQFDYSDLVDRLTKIKRSRRTRKRNMFKSLDLTLTYCYRHTQKNSNKRRTSNSSAIRVKKIENSDERNENYLTKPTHKRSVSDKFYQSDLIPLFTPGFLIYHRHDSTRNGRGKSVI